MYLHQTIAVLNFVSQKDAEIVLQLRRVRRTISRLPIKMVAIKIFEMNERILGQRKNARNVRNAREF